MEKDLKNIKWGEFYIKDIFNDIQRGKRLKKADHKRGETPYISSTSLNNGVDNFIGNEDRVRIFSDCLTVANSGSVGATFYHPSNVIASDHVTKLANKKFNKYVYLFISTIISRLAEKYSFNREINDNRIQKEKIMLPINKEGTPDYAFMEIYIKRLEKEKLKNYLNYAQQKMSGLNQNKGGVTHFSEKEWGEFFIENLFKIYTGGDLILQNVKKGIHPIISHSKENNGIASFSNEIKNKKLFNSNTTISLADRGNFWASTQLMDFYIGTRVKALESKFTSNRFILKFISLSINKQDVRFSYGNNATAKTGKIKILLPIDKKGNPDYTYMENYIKKLEYEKLKSYLLYKNSTSL